MINNIKHLLRTIKHLFMILLIFLLIYDTKVSLCYIHEAYHLFFHVLTTGAISYIRFYFIGGIDIQIETKNNIALASNTKARTSFSLPL